MERSAQAGDVAALVALLVVLGAFAYRHERLFAGIGRRDLGTAFLDKEVAAADAEAARQHRINLLNASKILLIVLMQHGKTARFTPVNPGTREWDPASTVGPPRPQCRWNLCLLTHVSLPSGIKFGGSDGRQELESLAADRKLPPPRKEAQAADRRREAVLSRVARRSAIGA